jgi:hypothetical protein
MRIVAFFLVLVIMQSCCCNGCQRQPPDQPVGTVSREKDTVRAGPSGSLSTVSGSRDLYDNDGVMVTGGGRARLDFGSNIVIYLFNETGISGVSGEVDPGVPHKVAWKLERGGVSGHMVDPGGSTTIDVSTGVRVMVYGTQFFVLVEPGTGYTVVGNFDGTVEWAFGDQTHPLGPGRFVDVDPQGGSREYELPFSPDMLLEASDRSGSDLAGGLENLRREFKLERNRQDGEPPRPSVVVRYLVVRDGDNYIPDLAQAWDVFENGNQWTFHLREGIRNADGSPFTAFVVLERVQGVESMRSVKSSVIDDLTIQFYIDTIEYSTDILFELSQIPFEVQQ